MKKTFLLLFTCLLIVIPLGSSIVFDEDTTFKKGGISWTLQEGLNVTTFDFITNGLVLDDTKFVFIPVGGTLNITINNLEEKEITISSSVEQEVIYKVSVDKKSYVLKSNEEFFIDTIIVNKNPKIYTYELLDVNQKVDNIIIYEYQEGFLKSNLFVFVINSGDDYKTISFKYYQLLLVMITIGIIYYIVKKNMKKVRR